MQQALAGCWLLLCAFLAGLIPLAHADELAAIPPLTARVTDTSTTLTAAQIAQLDAELAAFEASKGSQIAVLIVPSTQPEPIESYSLRVVEAWKLGRKRIDDGVLLIVAKDDRRLRIEVGYGLEGALTDVGSRRIIAETITPRFKTGDFYGGIEAGVQQIIAVVSGEPLPAVDDAASAGAGLPDDVIGGVVMWAAGILSALLGRFLPWPARIIIAGGLATAIGMLMSNALIGALCFAGILVLSASRPSGISTASAGSSSVGGGNRGRTSYSSGRSGGSFSGGGGRFGGGGSSGSW